MLSGNFKKTIISKYTHIKNHLKAYFKIAILLFLYCQSTETFAQEDKMAEAERQDDLAKYIYAVLDEFQQDPSIAGINFLTEIETSLWRSPKNDKEQLAMVYLLCNKGYYQKKAGQLHPAIHSYKKALSSFENNKLSGYDIIEYCQKPLGNLYTMIGDYTHAEETIMNYLILAENEKKTSHIIAGAINLSIAYHSQGLHHEAITLLERISQSYPKAVNNSNISNNLASNYIAIKNFEKAKTYAKKALKSNPGNTSEIVNVYKNLSLIAIHQQNPQKAQDYIEASKKELFANPNTSVRALAKIHLEHSTLLKQQKKEEQAEESLQKAFRLLIPGHQKGLPDIASLYAETTLVDLLDFYAELLIAKNQLDLCLKAFDLSFHVQELLKTSLSYEKSKLVQQISNRDRSERCITLLLNAHKKDPDPAYLEKALAYAERSKGSLLKDELTKGLALSSFFRKDFLNELAELKSKKALIDNQIITEYAKKDHANLSKLQLLKKTQNALVQILKEKDDIVSRKLAKFGSLQGDFKLSQLQLKLKKEEAKLIEYFYGKEQLFIFRVTSESINVVSISRTDGLDEKLLDFIRLFDTPSGIANDVTYYNRSAFQLFRQLGLSFSSEEKKVVIIPDGKLYFLPFEALLTEPSESLLFEKLPYVLNSNELAYNHSAKLYYQTTPLEIENPKILGLFPVFENSKSPLQHSIQEANAIEHNYEGDFLKKEKATKNAFMRNASDFDILHLSTHASGGDSTIPASISFRDEKIYLPELYALYLPNKLAVLSACETGVGRLQKGEGAMSLARGFSMAGIQHMVFSLWKVNDRSTADIMGRFYENYKNTGTIHKANSISKKKYLNDSNISNAKKSPYYWASFVYYGTIEKQENNYYYLFLFLLIPIIALFLFRKRKGQ